MKYYNQPPWYDNETNIWTTWEKWHKIITSSKKVFTWQGRVYRTYFRIDSQTPNNTATTPQSSKNDTLPAMTQRRRLGISSIQGSCRAPQNQSIRKSTMVVTSSMPNSSWWATRQQCKKTSELNPRARTNWCPSERSSLSTSNNNWPISWTLMEREDPDILHTTRDNDDNSASGTRWPRDSTLTHTSKRPFPFHVRTTQCCPSSWSSNDTQYAPKASARKITDRRTQGKKARHISNCKHNNTHT